MFADCYKGKKVLITGHTGFKGSWLAFWLEKLNAEICGLALEPDGENAHFRLLRPRMRSECADIRDLRAVRNIFQDFQPDIVFHLAAQPLVRKSYACPVSTFDTNLMGTVHVLEAIRETPSVRAAVLITTDKCYENRETDHAYTEQDPLGGHDPYSASKGCAEIAISAWRRSFFHRPDAPLIASARAGNVIGGGDWAEDRLVPDLVKAAADGMPAPIRNPHSIRPWQHVLEPLAGYLMLGRSLLEGKRKNASAWNFGPAAEDAGPVRRLADFLSGEWNRIQPKCLTADAAQPHEAGLLRLDCTKANTLLGWHPVWNTETAARKTAAWYRAFFETGTLNTEADWQDYCRDAEKLNLEWTRS